MRRLAVLSVIALALALPAAAQDGGRISASARDQASAVSLRGPIGASVDEIETQAPGSAALAALVPVPPPVAPAGSSAAVDSRQCKRSCNRDYYFCLSADEETCAPAWTKCTASCSQL